LSLAVVDVQLAGFARKAELALTIVVGGGVEGREEAGTAVEAWWVGLADIGVEECSFICTVVAAV